MQIYLHLLFKILWIEFRLPVYYLFTQLWQGNRNRRNDSSKNTKYNYIETIFRFKNLVHYPRTFQERKAQALFPYIKGTIEYPLKSIATSKSSLFYVFLYIPKSKQNEFSQFIVLAYFIRFSLFQRDALPSFANQAENLSEATTSYSFDG